MEIHKIVNSDNYDSDYPDERFVEGLPCLGKEGATVICAAINSTIPVHSPRYFKVVPADYKLQPGFEP